MGTTHCVAYNLDYNNYNYNSEKNAEKNEFPVTQKNEKPIVLLQDFSLIIIRQTNEDKYINKMNFGLLFRIYTM